MAGVERHERTVWKLLVDVYFELNIVQDSVVLWINTFPFFTFLIVSHVRDLKDSSLLESPLRKLFAEVVI